MPRVASALSGWQVSTFGNLSAAGQHDPRHPHPKSEAVHWIPSRLRRSGDVHGPRGSCLWNLQPAGYHRTYMETGKLFNLYQEMAP